MKTTAADILSRIPRRRPRQWRYVSPHRRGAGVVILALLAVGVLAYWFVPRLINVWIRDQAVAYLGSVTGGRVVIDGARFSLFSGIELNGVGVDLPESPRRERFFRAKTVVLRHRPWGLLSRRRLEPTEIVCIAPTVTLEYDAEKGRYTAEELIAGARRHSLSGRAGPFRGILPVISIRDVRLRTLTGQTRLNISMVPVTGTYRVTLEEQGAAGQEPLRGIWQIDLATGRIRLEESNIPKIAHTDGLLPAKYAEWRRRYDIHGQVVLKGRPAGASGKALLEAHLHDVSLKLQPAEGGLHLTGVRGTLTFREDGVSAQGLTGRVHQAGNAAFRMSGRYDGYDPNSPFDLHIVAEEMVLPSGSGATDWLAETLKFLNETFQPTGKLDISADFKRKANGQIDLKGSARPRGMSFVYKWFPYRLDRVKGEIRFVAGPSADRVYLTDVIGRRGGAVVTVGGEIDLRKGGKYDVTVRGKQIALDAAVRAALRQSHQGVWDTFRPTGTTDATVRVRKAGPGKPRDVEVLLSMTGKASAAYRGFPYRLDGLEGRVRISERGVVIDSLHGRRGPMRCTVDGSLGGFGGSGGQTDLSIEAMGLPLDANLMAALPEAVRKVARTLHATGSAERVSVTVRQSKGQPLGFRAVARLRNTSFRADAFPYEVRDASGVVTVQPGRLIIEELAGRHGRTPVQLSGQVLLGRQTPTVGVDLRVRAKGAVLDKELFAAVPDAVKKIWRKLAASGRADVDLSLQQRMPDAKREFDYRLVLQADGLAVRYQDFPYSLADMVGQAVATPEGVTLSKVEARHGQARFVISGDLKWQETSESARLSLQGTKVPIDPELLAAVPGTLAPLAGRFRPGGTCDIALKDFQISRRIAPGGKASSRPTSGPASGPAAAGPVSWSMTGEVAFHGATLDVGLGHKTLSGSLRGVAEQRRGALALDATIALDSVQVGRQRLTHLSGRLTKEPRGQLMRLDDLSAKAHGGQVAGFAEIRLVDPLEFGVSLSVEAIRLADLFGAAANGARSKVEGLLAGNVQVTATAGKKPRRQAAGVLSISRGKLYKLPVMLGLLHMVYLSLPGETAFTDGNLTYHLRNDTLVFDEIYLRGAALSIVGSGTMNMKTEALNLTFLTGPPRKLPRLGSLSELLEGIVREVAEIHVGGTLQKPKMRTVPLRGLDGMLRDILNPGRRK